MPTPDDNKASFAFCMRDRLCKKDFKLTIFARGIVGYAVEHFSTTFRLLHAYAIVKTYHSKPLVTTEVVELHDLSAHAPPFADCVSPDPGQV